MLTMDIYICGLVCLCIHPDAYCSNINYSNLPADINYVYVKNILVERRNIGTTKDYNNESVILDTKKDARIPQKKNDIVTTIRDYVSTQKGNIFIKNNTSSSDIISEGKIYSAQLKTIIILSCAMILILFACTLVYYIINKRSVNHNQPSIDIEMGELSLPMNQENGHHSSDSNTAE